MSDFVLCFLCPVSSLVAQRLKHLPAMRETWVQSLGREDPLEEGMATQSSILPWRNQRTEKPGRLQSMGSCIVRHLPCMQKATRNEFLFKFQS